MTKSPRLTRPTALKTRIRGRWERPMTAIPVITTADIAETAWIGETCARMGPSAKRMSSTAMSAIAKRLLPKRWEIAMWSAPMHSADTVTTSSGSEVAPRRTRCRRSSFASPSRRRGRRRRREARCRRRRSPPRQRHSAAARHAGSLGCSATTASRWVRVNAEGKAPRCTRQEDGAYRSRR